MHKNTIPSWTAEGILPPIAENEPGHSFHRSPYHMNITSLCEHFGRSSERARILEGFLAYRKKLHSLGLTTGFQWINGSFVEDVERIEERPPQDIDVVTFAELSDGMNQRSLINAEPNLFEPDHTQAKYYVDAYYLFLNEPLTRSKVKSISYWYSMWSHRRDGQWKGFLQIDLTPVENEEGLEILMS